MGLKNVFPGYNFSAEFISSAIPWVTSSTATGPKQYRFGDVTLSGSLANEVWVSKWIMVNNTATTSNPMKVAFTLNGFATSHYFTLDANQSWSSDVRITEIWVSGTNATPHEIIVGLTGINGKDSIAITGSSGVPGVG